MKHTRVSDRAFARFCAAPLTQRRVFEPQTDKAAALVCGGGISGLCASFRRIRGTQQTRGQRDVAQKHVGAKFMPRRNLIIESSARKDPAKKRNP